MKIKEETKIVLILLVLVLISLVITMLPIIINIKIEVILYYIFGLMTLSMILSYLTEKSKSKILQKISFIFSIPISIIHLILSLGIPTCVLLFNALILFIVSFGIPLLLMNQIEILFNFGLKKSTMLFFCISFATILSVYVSKYLLKFILKFSPITMDTYAEKTKNKYLKELTSIFYQKNNIVFFIYACYFIYLGIMSFFKIQYGKPLLSAETDLAILQSFLVFIAFTNMILKSKDVKLSPKTILYLYAKIIFYEDIIENPDTINKLTNQENKVEKD